MRRQRNARGEGERLRIELLEAAADLMATHGDIESISLRAVAREAGVSATAVYRHFDDHHDLLRESVEYCWTNFRQALIDSTVGVSDPFDELRALRRGLRAVRVRPSRAVPRDVLQPDRARQTPTATIGLAAYQLLVDAVGRILDALGDDRNPYFVAAQLHTWMHGVVDLWSQPSRDAVAGHRAACIDGMVEALRLRRPVTDT